MRKYDMKVTRDQKRVIETCQTLKYGSIENVHIDIEQKKEIPMVLEEPFKLLVDTLSQYPKIDRIIIHQGYPMYADVCMEVNGLKVIQKFKYM